VHIETDGSEEGEEGEGVPEKRNLLRSLFHPSGASEFPHLQSSPSKVFLSHYHPARLFSIPALTLNISSHACSSKLKFRKKVKVKQFVLEEPAPKRETACHMGSPRISCQPESPSLTPASTQFTHQLRMKG